MEQFLPYIIQAISGLVGGNIAGLLAKAKSLGPILNSILGAVGGIGAAQGAQAAGILEAIGLGSISGTGADIGLGAIGGLILPLLGSLFKKK